MLYKNCDESVEDNLICLGRWECILPMVCWRAMPSDETKDFELMERLDLHDSLAE
jgi:hypothetical protein